MSDKSDSPQAIRTSGSSPPVSSVRDNSPKIDRKVKNFSAKLRARARAEAKKDGTWVECPDSIDSRPGSSASTIRPDSVLSFRDEVPTVKQSDFGSFRPESVSILPPDSVTTIRPDSVAAVHAAGQGVFRPFQAPAGPTARFNIQYQASSSESDWEAKDEMRQRELEEMRARAAQMEKTMRWWSDCTANWREKWSKVRNERNKAREDCRQLRSKLEIVVKECTGLKREKQEMITEADKLRTELELHQTKDPDKDSDSLSTSSSISVKSQPDDANWDQAHSTRPRLTPAMLEAKIEELNKMLAAERDEKESLRCQVDDEKSQILSLQSHVAELEYSKKALTEQLQLLKGEGGPLTFIDEDSERASQQLDSLRQQLERLQTENASEWAKQERLSSEKMSLERENNRLRSVVDDLREQVTNRSSGAMSSQDINIRSLQTDITQKAKEYNDLKHQHIRLRQQFADSQTEQEHTSRRSEQFESEVRQLRARIEQLKDQLLSAENELDSQTNIARKLQRQNEDLKLSNENFVTQNEHLKARLKVLETEAYSEDD